MAHSLDVLSRSPPSSPGGRSGCILPLGPTDGRTRWAAEKGLYSVPTAIWTSVLVEALALAAIGRDLVADRCTRHQEQTVEALAELRGAKIAEVHPVPDREP